MFVTQLAFLYHLHHLLLVLKCSILIRDFRLDGFQGRIQSDLYGSPCCTFLLAGVIFCMPLSLIMLFMCCLIRWLFRLDVNFITIFSLQQQVRPKDENEGLHYAEQTTHEILDKSRIVTQRGGVRSHNVVHWCALYKSFVLHTEENWHSPFS